MFEEAGVRVGGYMGSEAPPGGFASVDIAICTIEKANSLVNRLLEEKKISSLACIVIDEMHMIGDPGRGYLLELLLTKIRFITTTTSPLSGIDLSPIQIIGMSATLPNLDMLSSWLQADLYCTSYRPVPLSEHVKVGRSVFDSENKRVYEVQASDTVKGDEEHIIPLCLEIIRNGNSVLIFCPTKNWCEKLSATIAKHFKENPSLRAGSQGFVKASELCESDGSVLDEKGIQDVLEQLKRTPVGLDQGIGNVVSQAVAFHHAGLTFDERDIIEGAFRRGVLRVLVATSTLSSGKKNYHRIIKCQ